MLRGCIRRGGRWLDGWLRNSCVCEYSAARAPHMYNLFGFGLSKGFGLTGSSTVGRVSNSAW